MTRPAPVSMETHMKALTRLAACAAFAACGVLTAAPASAMQLVDRVTIAADQTVRLNVALSEAGPKHCRVTLTIMDVRGRRVSSRGPLRLAAGSSTSVEMKGAGRFNALLATSDPRCRTAADATIEVF